MPSSIPDVVRFGKTSTVAKLIYAAIASLDGYVEDEEGSVRLGGAG